MVFAEKFFSMLVCFFCSLMIWAQTPVIDAKQLLDHTRILSSDAFEGRQTGTPGNKKGRDYIISQFQRLQIQPLGDHYEQPFSFKMGEDTIEGNNVIGLVPGSKFVNHYIVISAHHDHLGNRNGTIFNGADDNASGVGALLIFAEYLSQNPPNYSVILVAFDAEEIGLKGAKHFVEEMAGKDIILNINMDMIGRSQKNELYVTGTRYNNQLQKRITELNNPTDTQLIIGHDGTDGKQDWTYASDHAPFHSAGIPFLYFGNEDHKDYHGPNDDFELMTHDFYINAVTIILSVIDIIDSEGL